MDMCGELKLLIGHTHGTRRSLRSMQNFSPRFNIVCAFSSRLEVCMTYHIQTRRRSGLPHWRRHERCRAGVHSPTIWRRCHHVRCVSEGISRCSSNPGRHASTTFEGGSRSFDGLVTVRRVSGDDADKCECATGVPERFRGSSHSTMSLLCLRVVVVVVVKRSWNTDAEMPRRDLKQLYSSSASILTVEWSSPRSLVHRGPR